MKHVEPPRPEEVKHQPCDASLGTVQAVVPSAGEHATVSRVVDSAGKELCRAVDFDHNGKPDLYQYFDDSGAVVRQEMAFDGTGAITSIEYYEGGHLARRELDLIGGHRIDTWEYFDAKAAPDPKTGRVRPSRVERDTKGEGHITEWWSWHGDKLSIMKDKDGDGKPDPSTLVVVGGASSDAPADDKGDAGAPPDGGTSSDAGVAPDAATPPSAAASTPVPAAAPASAPAAPAAPDAGVVAAPPAPPAQAGGAK